MCSRSDFLKFETSFFIRLHASSGFISSSNSENSASGNR